MSLKTDNFKLYKYEDNDIGDLRFINDSMDIIDKGLSPFYVATQSSTNVYKVTTGLNKTSLANGYSIKVAIPSNSTGAVSITVDSVTVPVKKPNGNAVTNFKQNGVYSLTYYNSVFILASGGVDDVNFSASDLLTGKTANDSNGEKVNGTMPNKGAVTATLNCGGSYTIPKGYHNGSGKVTANSLSSQTSANATAKDIIKGKTAWVNGSKITGTATIQSLGGVEHKTGTKDKINYYKSVAESGYSNLNRLYFRLEKSLFSKKPIFIAGKLKAKTSFYYFYVDLINNKIISYFYPVHGSDFASSAGYNISDFNYDSGDICIFQGHRTETALHDDYITNVSWDAYL